MSEQENTPMTEEQRKAIITRMFKEIHKDLGTTITLLTQKPTVDGFVVATEVAGAIVSRLTRGMGGLEKLIQMSEPKPKDDALVSPGWSTEPAPPDDGLPVMTEAAKAEAQAKAALVDTISQMTVTAVNNITAKTLKTPGQEHQ